MAPARVIVYGRDASEATRELLAACQRRGIACESRNLEPVQPAPNRREALAKLRAANLLGGDGHAPPKAGAAAGGAGVATSGLRIEIPLVDVEGELLQAPSVEQILSSIRARGFSEPEHAARVGAPPGPSAGGASGEQLVVYTHGPAEAEPWAAALVRQLRAAGLSAEVRDTLGSGALATAARHEMWALARAAPWWQGGEMPLAFPLVHAYGAPLLQRPPIDAVLRARQAAGLAAPRPARGAEGGGARLITIYSRPADGETARLRAELEGAALAYAFCDIDASADAAQALWAAMDAAAEDGGGAAGAGRRQPRLPAVEAYGTLLFAPTLADVRLAREAAGLPPTASTVELFAAADLTGGGGGGGAPSAPPALWPPLLSDGATSAGAPAERPSLARALSLSLPAVLSACGALGVRFEDPDFPPGPASLFRQAGRPPRGHTSAGVAWLRPAEIHPQARLFPGAPGSAVLVQGLLADGWLLSAMGVLAASTPADGAADAADGEQAEAEGEPRELGGVGIRARFVRHDAARGVLCASLFVDGGWRQLLTDDRIPCDARTRTPLYGRALDPTCMWAPLLEKAAAKAYGCYEALGGASLEAGLRLLTGGHARGLPLPAAAAAAAAGARGPTPPDAAAAVELAGAVAGALAAGSLVALVAGAATSRAVPGGFGGLRTVEGGLWRGRAYAIVDVANGGGPAGEAWLRLENRFGPEQGADGAWDGARPPADIIAGAAADSAAGAQAASAASFWMPASAALRLGAAAFKECVLAPASSHGLALAPGAWAAPSAGGGPHSSSFPLNPHYRLTVPRDATALIVLHAPDARLARAGAPAPTAAGVGGVAGAPSGRAASGAQAAGASARRPAIGFVLTETELAPASSSGAPTHAPGAASGSGEAGGAGGGGAELARLTDLSAHTRLAEGLRWARTLAVGEVVSLRAARAYTLVPCTLAPGVLAPYCLAVRASCALTGAPVVPTLELLPPPADEEAAEELVAAYRHDLMPFPPPATAGARPAAARAAPRARAEEADFSPEGEATEWDARLPAADPRLPAAARLAVQVRVMRARGLPPKDEGAETRAALRAGRPPPAGPSALASAYCVVTLDDLHRRQRARTRVIPGSCAPCWEEAFTFEGASAEAAIVLDVFDADPFGDDDFLGKATLQLGGLPRDGSAVERTVRLIEGALEVGITIWP